MNAPTRLLTISLGAAVLLSAGAMAQDDDAQAAPRQSASNQDPDLVITENASAEESVEPELICKTEPMLGSRVRVKRTCLTEQQWEEARENALRQVRLIEERGGVPEVNGWQH